MRPQDVKDLLGTKQFWKRLQEDPGDLNRELCSIHLEELDETLQTHASLRAWVNSAFELAVVEEAILKWEEKKLRAKELLNVDKTDPTTQKVKTIATMEAEVELTGSVRQATANVFAQQRVTGGLRALMKALDDRKDMLVQISAKQRKELENY